MNSREEKAESHRPTSLDYQRENLSCCCFAAKTILCIYIFFDTAPSEWRAVNFVMLENALVCLAAAEFSFTYLMLTFRVSDGLLVVSKSPNSIVKKQREKEIFCTHKRAIETVEMSIHHRYIIVKRSSARRIFVQFFCGLCSGSSRERHH